MGISCPKCGRKTSIRKRRKDGQLFHVCTRYPECKGMVKCIEECDDKCKEEIPVEKRAMAYRDSDSGVRLKTRAHRPTRKTPGVAIPGKSRVPNSSALAIEARGLVKVFGKIRAVDGIDLTVHTGGVYGFLGPNGAGKTTTINILATLLRPDSGTARVFGHDIVREANAVRSRVSLTGQFASVDEDLTGTENLVLLARLLGYSWSQAKARSRELLEAFDLTNAAGRQVKAYSGGMRRRIDLAASIVSTPDLLFLDEPTSGLDPHSRNHVWGIVRALVAEGTTVLLTTQHLEEADRLADRIAVIDHGRIIAEGTSGELKSSVGSGAFHVRLRNPERRPEAQKLLSLQLGMPVYLEADPAELSIRISDQERIASVLAALSRSDIQTESFSFGQPSLDDVFFSLTGHQTENVEGKEVA